MGKVDLNWFNKSDLLIAGLEINLNRIQMIADNGKR